MFLKVFITCSQPFHNNIRQQSCNVYMSSIELRCALPS